MTTPKPAPPREWLISDDGRSFEILDGLGIIIEYKGAPPKNPVSVIEKSAYDELQAKLSQAKAEVWRQEDKLVAVAKDRDALITEIKLEREISAMLREALERTVGTVERWTDEHGQRRVEESDASRYAREAIAKEKEMRK